jgi:dihydrofolate synthase/folylpolyglutamate synthase
VVFGVLSDKDLAGMLAALAPAVRRLHLVAPASPRARPASELLALAAARGLAADVHADLPAALRCARAAAGSDGVVCVAGSLYLVGEARGLLARAEPR